MRPGKSQPATLESMQSMLLQAMADYEQLHAIHGKNLHPKREQDLHILREYVDHAPSMDMLRHQVITYASRMRHGRVLGFLWQRSSSTLHTILQEVMHQFDLRAELIATQKELKDVRSAFAEAQKQHQDDLERLCAAHVKALHDLQVQCDHLEQEVILLRGLSQGEDGYKSGAYRHSGC